MTTKFRSEPVTVARMIELLQNMPQDAIVLTRGYEEGFDLASEPSHSNMVHDPGAEWFFGEFREKFYTRDHDLKEYSVVIV